MNWKKEMEEDRKIRKEHADYEFIEKQPLRLRKGLEAIGMHLMKLRRYKKYK